MTEDEIAAAMDDLKRRVLSLSEPFRSLAVRYSSSIVDQVEEMARRGGDVSVLGQDTSGAPTH